MSEQYTGSMNRSSIDQFLHDLSRSELPLPKGWTFQSGKEAHISSGETFLMIRWEPEDDSERLKAKFAFKKGQSCPLLSLVFDDANLLKEIELWSGEPMSFKRLPCVADLKTPAELGWQDKS